MGQAKLYGQKSSGIDIDGLIQDYYVYAGKKVSVGDFVEFLNGVASQTTTTKTSSNVSFHDKEVVYLSAVKVNDNSVFVAYKSNDGSTNYFGTRVLTIDNEKITVGTEYIPSAGIPYYISTTLVSTNKVAICFENVNNYKASAIIATISGTTISFGTYLSFGTGSSSYPDEYTQIETLDETHLLVCWSLQRNTSTTTYGLKAVVLTLDETTLTKGTILSICAYKHMSLSLCKLDSLNAILSDIDIGNSYRGISRILTISGTTITSGDKFIFYDIVNSIRYVTSCLISSNKVLITYGSVTDVGYESVIATISGTIITFGSSYNLNYTSAYPISSCLIEINKVLVSFNENGTNNYLQVLNISGTSVISNGDKYLLGAGSYFIDSVLIGENKIITIYKSTDTTNHGNSQVLGISENTISNKIKVVNTTYETQVQKSTTPNIYGVAKTEGTGGTSTAHGNQVKIIKPLVAYDIQEYPVKDGEIINKYDYVSINDYLFQDDIIPKNWTEINSTSFISDNGIKLLGYPSPEDDIISNSVKSACDGNTNTSFYYSGNGYYNIYAILQFPENIKISQLKVMASISTSSLFSSLRIYGGDTKLYETTSQSQISSGLTLITLDNIDDYYSQYRLDLRATRNTQVTFNIYEWQIVSYYKKMAIKSRTSSYDGIALQNGVGGDVIQIAIPKNL